MHANKCLWRLSFHQQDLVIAEPVGFHTAHQFHHVFCQLKRKQFTNNGHFGPTLKADCSKPRFLPGELYSVLSHYSNLAEARRLFSTFVMPFYVGRLSRSQKRMRLLISSSETFVATDRLIIKERQNCQNDKTAKLTKLVPLKPCPQRLKSKNGK